MPSAPLFTKLLIALLAAALLAAGCGSDDDDASAESTDVAVAVADGGGSMDVSFVVVDGKVDGGEREVEVTEGDEVTVRIESDADGEIHMHGFDITETVTPTEPGEITFLADVTGIFELELHGEDGDLALGAVKVSPA